MDHELVERITARKWQQMSTDEKLQEIEMIRKSRYAKLLPLLFLQQRLKQII